MLDDKRKYFCVGLPYQLAIKENLLDRDQVEDEMSEEDFDPISWSINKPVLFKLIEPYQGCALMRANGRTLSLQNANMAIPC